MGFMEYSNKTQSNIIPKEEFDEMVRETFNIISSNLCKSLGPLGSSATIMDGLQIEATKDGHDILSKYRFHNRYKKMIYKLICAPCERMNNTVGDGTTTAIALTNALYNRYLMHRGVLETLYRLPRQFTKVWDEIIEDLSKRVAAKSVTIDSSDYDTIYHIAYVTSNGSAEISENIARVYQESGTPFIRQKDSPTNKSYIQPIDGYDFPTNLIDDIFVRNEDLSAEENDIAVMIFDHKIETDIFNNVIKPIHEVIRAQGRKLLIVAPAYDKLFCDTVFENYIKIQFRSGGITLLASQYSTSHLKKNQLLDLSVILRAKPINQELAAEMASVINGEGPDRVVDSILNDEDYGLYRLIGSSSHASLSCTNGSVFRSDGITEDARYQDILNRAKKDLEDAKAHTTLERQSYAAKIYDANARVQQLMMKNYTYYIGANSSLQARITWDSVEDVIKCVRSAIKYGVVPGCQLSLLSACSEMTVEILQQYQGEKKEDSGNVEYEVSEYDALRTEILAIIHSALVDVYGQVLHGADGMGMTKTIPDWGTINVEDKEAIQNLKNEALKKGADIIAESVKRNQVFDLETLKFNPDIITSAETDCMVLSVASELVKILISGNQCIFLDSDVDESHEEVKEVYV